MGSIPRANTPPPVIDKTLSVEGAVAESKSVGKALGLKNDKLTLKTQTTSVTTDQWAQCAISLPVNSFLLYWGCSSAALIFQNKYDDSYIFRAYGNLQTSGALDWKTNTSLTVTLYYI